jgi:glycerophosphoryl diester phosphodiesterase
VTDRPPTAVAIRHDARAVRLKWHKLRRAAAEPPFSLANLAVGLAAGASVEIDLRRLADDAWVMLHDDVLDEETTGKGPVAALDSAGARQIRIAGAGYAPPLLADLAETVRGVEVHPDALLQIDLKEPASGITDRAVATFAEVFRPIAAFCVLSSGDWPAVTRLGAAVPGLRLGFDPGDLAEGRDLDDRPALRRFLDEVLATAPGASIYYLWHRFVAAAFAQDVDPIGVLQDSGALIDVWTLDPTTPFIDRILVEMVEAGADQITTNDPDGMARIWGRIAPR